MKKAYKTFDTEYLIYYEELILHRWQRYFKMLMATNEELQNVRDELNERPNNPNRP